VVGVRVAARGSQVMAVVAVGSRLTLLVGVARASVLAHVRVRRAEKDRVISVSLDVLLEILRSLESLSTEVALVRLEGNVDANVRCDVIALDGCDAARTPVASQVEVVCALATDVTFAYVLIKSLSCLMAFTTVQPLASEGVDSAALAKGRGTKGMLDSLR